MILRPFNIARLPVAPNLVLAPMSGVTSIAFRRLLRELNPGSVGLVVSEFISIEGLTRGNDQSLRMMEYREEERPVSIQIFGHEISRMVDAAKMVEDSGANVIDINSGCPVPKVVRKGGGCELMRQPEHLEKILRAVRAAVRIPFTLKIRSGWDEKNRNAFQIAKMAEDCGVDMLAVHGRTRQDLYRGDADWEIVAEIASALSIPVVGSGDVVDAESARRALSSGVAGVMIGRGALANPWIFSEISAELAGQPSPQRTPEDILHVLRRYTELLLEHGSQRAALGKLKQLSSQVTRRIRGSAGARRALCTSSSLAELRSRLDAWSEALASGRPFPGDTDVQHLDSGRGALAPASELFA